MADGDEDAIFFRDRLLRSLINVHDGLRRLTVICLFCVQEKRLKIPQFTNNLTTDPRI